MSDQNQPYQPFVHVFAETYQATIYIGGSAETARRFINGEAWLNGMCVTVEPTRFIYTGGEERGVRIGFLNYPRFPKPFPDIAQQARMMAEKLIPVLNQKSALVVTTNGTLWITATPPGTPATEKGTS